MARLFPGHHPSLFNSRWVRETPKYKKTGNGCRSSGGIEAAW
jgi:hypothetical protein